MFMHYMYVNIVFPLIKAIPILFERAATHYKTLRTWIIHNAMHYHNFDALPQTLAYIFSQHSLV